MALRMTVQTLLVLQALLRDPGRELYGLEVSEETGLLPGAAYPILLRLGVEGWVGLGWAGGSWGRGAGRGGWWCRGCVPGGRVAVVVLVGAVDAGCCGRAVAGGGREFSVRGCC